jgi:peptidoglycan/LPS O-acetylase OafA/YrhL
VTTDSRAIAPGDLFVALTGPRFDGHDFVAAARDAGAAAALVTTFGYSLFAATFAALVATALVAGERSWWRRALCAWPLIALGQYSYALYVFHQPIALVLRENGWQANLLPRLWGTQIPGLIVYGLLVAALSIGCAVLSWHLWEVRFLRLKRYFPYRGPAKAVSTTSPSHVVSTT